MEYTQVNKKQIAELINNGTLKRLTAIKNAPVKAIELTKELVDKILDEGGYQTVVIDDNGNAFVETTNKKINIGDFLVNNQIAGYDNFYIVLSSKFFSLYKKGEGSDIYNPVATQKTVYLIPEGKNLEFEAPWGGLMKIRSGGVIVPEDDNFYGINPEEFKATHIVL